MNSEDYLFDYVREQNVDHLELLTICEVATLHSSRGLVFSLLKTYFLNYLFVDNKKSIIEFRNHLSLQPSK